MASNTESPENQARPKPTGSSQNYYDLLGITPQATDEEIKRAYRKTALRLREFIFILYFLMKYDLNDIIKYLKVDSLILYLPRCDRRYFKYVLIYIQYHKRNLGFFSDDMIKLCFTSVIVNRSR